MTFNNKGWKHKKDVVISISEIEKAKEIFFKNGGEVEKLPNHDVVPFNHVNSKLGDSRYIPSEMTITLP